MAAKKAIGNYNDLKNFKVNMNLFNQDYNNQNNNRNKLIFGGSDANNNIGMNKFFNLMLPKLQGGYKNYKQNNRKVKKGGDDNNNDFNLIRDVLSPQSQSIFTNTNTTADMSLKTYNFPYDQSLSRSSF